MTHAGAKRTFERSRGPHRWQLHTNPQRCRRCLLRSVGRCRKCSMGNTFRSLGRPGPQAGLHTWNDCCAS
eukprot:11216305-Lingulodinium_polyedra.AAC.1